MITKTEKGYKGTIEIKPKRKTWSQEEKKVFAKERRFEISQAIEDINENVANVFTSDNWKMYLDFNSSFYQYSINNVALIWMQNPHATQVASFNDWKKKGRHVKKGEKGLKILVPINVKEEKINKDGTKEDTYKLCFKFGYTFDVSQTEGDEIPTICKDLQHSDLITDKFIQTLIQKLEKTTGFTIKYSDNCHGADGYCVPTTNEIVLLSNKSNIHTVATLMHECSHALNKETNLKRKTKVEKVNEEIVAEATAYTVLKHFGFDVGDYSFEYIASWSQNKKPNELKSVLENIRENANILIDAIENI